MDELEIREEMVGLEVKQARLRLEKLWDIGSKMSMEDFWNGEDYGKNLRHVRGEVRMLMSVPCSASKCDRNFSAIAMDVRKHRNRLAVSTVEALGVICDMCNQPDFNFEKLLETLIQLCEDEEVEEAAQMAQNGKEEEEKK
jgi:hypothetical protein